jgi:hypothetical protein
MKTIFALTIAAIALSGCSAAQHSRDIGFKMPASIITMQHRVEAAAIAAKIEAESKWHEVSDKVRSTSFLQYAPGTGPCVNRHTIEDLLRCE